MTTAACLLLVSSRRIRPPREPLRDGIVECDVAVTKDGALVCRHAQCDLHTTTDILGRAALASKCAVPFTAATAAAAAAAKCCTSDVTLAEFMTLKGKMDAADANASTPAEYMFADEGAARFPGAEGRVAGNSGNVLSRGNLLSRGTLLTHAQYVALLKNHSRKATTELKDYIPGAGMPTRDEIRSKMVTEYEAAGFPAAHVWLQSFNYSDVAYWAWFERYDAFSFWPKSATAGGRSEEGGLCGPCNLVANHGDFGRQAVFLDANYTDGTYEGRSVTGPSANKGALATSPGKAIGLPNFVALKAAGFNYVAPPQQMLLKNDDGKLGPSDYALAANAAGMHIITWTLERSGPLGGGGGFYYSTVKDLVHRDGDMLEVLHALDEKVGVKGVFTDWSATVTVYANCMLRRKERERCS